MSHRFGFTTLARLRRLTILVLLAVGVFSLPSMLPQPRIVAVGATGHAHVVGGFASLQGAVAGAGLFDFSSPAGPGGPGAQTAAVAAGVPGSNVADPTANGPSRTTPEVWDSSTGPDAHLLTTSNGYTGGPMAVPILLYHYVRIAPPGDRMGAALSVTPADFAQQMDALQARGFHTVRMADLRHAVADGLRLPSKPIVLTFDDGYADFATNAMPILRAHGFTGVAYIAAGLLGRPGYLSAAQVTDLSNQGVEIAAHTVSHPDLTRLTDAQLEREVGDGRTFLHVLTGQEVADFCYPFGRYDPRVMAAVDRAGFLTATTTHEGVGRDWGSRLTWARTRVSGGETLPKFLESLGEQ